MTTMDSDSESQDSDDGRRFRFEATRKDSVAPVDTAGRTKTPNKKSKHKSSHCESSRHYRDKKERSKHESDRKTDDKDPRHSIRHLRHESRNLRQEDSKKDLYKDHRDSRGTSAGSAANDRGSRNSSSGDTRERSRDSKRQSDRDRSVHRARERSYERNYHDERMSGDKHRSRYHERYNHRSRDKSRERSHQSSRVKSSNGDYRSRDDHGRHDSFKKTSIKENRSQNSREYSSPKNVERECSYSEARSSDNTKKDPSIEAQDCKDLDLSQFDVLSETDENMSDGRDSVSRTSSPHKVKRHSGDRSESSATKRENDDGASERKRQEEIKVKRRSYDPVSSSYNNNPSAVSDTSLGSASSATLSVTRETRTDSGKEKFEHCEEKRMITCDERSDLEEKYEGCLLSLDDTRLLERDAEQTGFTYGPLLPPGFVPNVFDGNELEKTSSNALNENKIHDKIDAKGASFIGPCLPSQLDDRQSAEREDTVISAMEAEAVFGPVLPPHLLERQRQNDSRDNIIGPVLPSTVKHKEDLAVSSESDDDCAIGPLPVDHPALRNSRIHEQLDLRAQRIKDQGYLEGEINVDNKREEWMTELPPAQAANLGLGPRKFRLRDGPDMSDRSCWTDTPAQRAQKQKDLEAKRHRESDKEQVKEFHKKETNKNGKREKSLLEMHQSKAAKKKRKEEKEAKRSGMPTRRPFDRDIDLQTNRLDQAQKKTILIKAQLLDDRFSREQI